MHTSRVGNAILAASLAAFLPAGCSNGPTGGGILNSAPGESGGSEKAGERSDLPVPGAGSPAGRDETLAGPAASSPAANVPGAAPSGAAPAPAPEAAGSTPGVPPAKENTGEAGGATKPSGDIKAGTPRGPGA